MWSTQTVSKFNREEPYTFKKRETQRNKEIIERKAKCRLHKLLSKELWRIRQRQGMNHRQKVPQTGNLAVKYKLLQ